MLRWRCALLPFLLLASFGACLFSNNIYCYANSQDVTELDYYQLVQNIETVHKRISDLEQKYFGMTYQDDLVTERLSRLEQKLFGHVNEGSPRKRLDILLLSSTDDVAATSNSINKGSNDSEQRRSHDVRIVSFAELKRLRSTSPQPIMVHIHADWALPSKRMIPFFAECAKNSQCTFVQIDFAKYSDELEKGGYFGKEQFVPTFVRLEKNSVVGKVEKGNEAELQKLCNLELYTAYCKDFEREINNQVHSKILAPKDMRVNFKINNSGQIVDTSISVYNSSGNKQIDNEIVKTLKKIPAPSPPMKEAVLLQIYCLKNSNHLIVRDTWLDVAPDYSKYLTLMEPKIRSKWSPPDTDKDQIIAVSFSVHSDGAINNVKTIKPSNSTEADLAAIKAVYTAAPLPALPSGFPDNIEVKFTFTKSPKQLIGPRTETGPVDVTGAW